MAWITPTVRPMMDTGMQRAERRPSGRLRSLGQASRWSLSVNSWICARRAAGQRAGINHAATRRLALGSDGSHAMEVRVAVVSQEQFGRSLGQHGGE